MNSLELIRSRSVALSAWAGGSPTGRDGWRRGARTLPFALALLLAGGCASSPKEAPVRPGAGLVEYRQMVMDLRKVTATARLSAEGLAAASLASGAAAWMQFDESVHRLEVVSMKTRARADAMEKRGASYFEEWTGDIAATTNAAARAKEEAREKVLRGHFDGVLEGAKLVRQEGRQFLEGLRQLRAAFSRETLASGLDKSRPALTAAAASGRKAELAMEALVGKLNVAETVLKSDTASAAQP